MRKKQSSNRELHKHYLRYSHDFDFLEEKEEFTLAKRWKENMDEDAAARLFSAHMRLVVKIASGYRAYGLSLDDLISEGYVGMLQALRKFEPAKGFRFSTYTTLWIKAQIRYFILNNWSLVKLGQSLGQRRLFFNLRQLKSHLGLKNYNDLGPEAIKEIAEKLKVSPQETINANKRLAHPDISLNQPILSQENDEIGEWQDLLIDETADQEAQLIYKDELEKRSEILREALSSLSFRQHRIFTLRRLTDPPLTLETLSKEFSISKERVRQIENKSFLQIQAFIMRHPLIRESSTPSTKGA